jgi:DNA-binding MarR family transcriptional regulator
MELTELTLNFHTNYLNLMRKISSQNQISVSQLLCIVSIPYKGIQQIELAKNLSLDVSTLSRNLDKLIIKELIIKKKAQLDQRAYRVSLSNKGKQLYEDIMLNINSLYQSVYLELDDMEIEQFKEILIKLNWLFISREN